MHHSTTPQPLRFPTSLAPPRWLPKASCFMTLLTDKNHLSQGRWPGPLCFIPEFPPSSCLVTFLEKQPMLVLEDPCSTTVSNIPGGRPHLHTSSSPRPEPSPSQWQKDWDRAQERRLMEWNRNTALAPRVSPVVTSKPWGFSVLTDKSEQAFSRVTERLVHV